VPFTKHKVVIFSFLSALAVHIVAMVIVVAGLSARTNVSLTSTSAISVQISAISLADDLPQEKSVSPKGEQRDPGQARSLAPKVTASGLVPKNEAAQAGGAVEPSPNHSPSTTPESLAALIRSRVEKSLNYPLAARRRGIQGSVQLALTLQANGSAREITVHTSSGSSILDRDAAALLASVLPVPVPADFPLTTSILITVMYQLQ